MVQRLCACVHASFLAAAPKDGARSHAIDRWRRCDLRHFVHATLLSQAAFYDAFGDLNPADLANGKTVALPAGLGPDDHGGCTVDLQGWTHTRGYHRGFLNNKKGGKATATVRGLVAGQRCVEGSAR